MSPSLADHSGPTCPMTPTRNRRRSAAASLTLRAASDGRPVWIPSIWAHRRVVLVFLRHLACRFCKEQILAMNTVAAKLEALDIPIVYISMGSPAQARELSKKLGLVGTIYVDPDAGGTVAELKAGGDEAAGESSGTDGQDSTYSRQQAQAYALFSLLRSERTTRHEKTVELATALIGKGIEDDEPDSRGAWPGDIFQVGGVFVLGPGNTCDYSYRSQYAGDHPDVSEVVAAATGVTNEGSDFLYPTAQRWANLLQVDEVVALPFRFWRPSFSVIALCFIAVGTIAVGLRVLSRSTADTTSGVIVDQLASQLSEIHPAWLYTALVVCTVFLAALLEWTIVGPTLSEDDIPALVTPEVVDRAALDAGIVDCDCAGDMEAIPVLGLQDIVDASELPRPATPSRPISRSNSRPNSRPPSPTLGRSPTQEDPAMVIDPRDFREMLCYVRYFLARPHPSVGRPGPVCPFVPQSLKKNCIYFAVIRDSHVSMTKQGVRMVAEHFLSRFEQLPPLEGRARQYKAIVMVFPDIADADAPRLIDSVQLELKAACVGRGLMIGEFHRFNNTPGLRNEHFYPLRTPTPCLAIRHMVPTDLAFLNIDDVELRRKFLTAFLGVFKASPKESEKEAVRKAEIMLKEAGGPLC